MPVKRIFYFDTIESSRKFSAVTNWQIGQAVHDKDHMHHGNHFSHHYSNSCNSEAHLHIWNFYKPVHWKFAKKFFFEFWLYSQSTQSCFSQTVMSCFEMLWSCLLLQEQCVVTWNALARSLTRPFHVKYCHLVANRCKLKFPFIQKCALIIVPSVAS